MFNQSTGAVRAVSLLEDIRRQFQSKGQSLRPGQEAAFAKLCHHDGIKAAFELPTGYGKTVVLLGGYALLKERNGIDRMLWVVPSDTMRQQGDECVVIDGNKMGLDFVGSRLVSGEPNEIKYSWRNQAEIFITTVQHIDADPDFYADLMSKNEWLVCCDEFQRYAEDSSWGKAILNLDYSYLLGVSGTPIRTDQRNTLFSKGDMLHSVSKKQAREEGSIRGIKLGIEKYSLDISLGTEEGPPSESMLHLTTSNIQSQLQALNCTSLSVAEIRYKIRYHTKYLSSMLTAAIGSMLAKAINGQRHQMIVYCMTVAHAKTTCEAINQMNGEVRADWIGDGKDAQRSAKENAKVIDRFQKYDINCLVQVKKAGEGFDSVYASTLVFLNLLNDRSVEAEQFLGRGLRRHPDIADPKLDFCHVFVSEDSGLADFYKTILEDMGGDPTAPVDGTPNEDPNWIDIPSFFLIDVEHTGEDVEYPLGPPEGQEENAKAIAVEYKAAHPGIDMDELDALINNKLHKAVAPKQKTETEKYKAIRTAVASAVAIHAGNLIRKRFGRSFEKSARGDMVTNINRKLKINFGPRDQLTFDELLRAYNWLRANNQQIEGAKEIPEWAEL